MSDNYSVKDGVFYDSDGCRWDAVFEFGGEQHLDEGRAVAELLLDGVLFVNSRKYLCYDGKTERPATLVLFVNCNDIFAWACADAEQVEMKELLDLYQMHVADKKWGAAKWCCKKRNQRPQYPVERDMRADGSWDDTMEKLCRNTSHDTCCPGRTPEN